MIRSAFLLAAMLALPGSAAQAQSAVKAGGKVLLHWYIAMGGDCGSIGKTIVSSIHDPTLGTLEIVDGTHHPNFPAINPRHICNDKKAPATFVYYRAKPGVKGIDTFAFDVITGFDRPRRQSFFVSVE